MATGMPDKPSRALAVCLSLFLLAFCAVCDDSEAPHTIQVYGTAACPYTQDTMAELDARKLEYTFYDVHEDDEKHDEMWEKVDEQLPGTKTVSFPVVDVWGTVLMRPAIEEIEAAMH